MDKRYKLWFGIISAVLISYAAVIWYQSFQTLAVHGDAYRAKIGRLGNGLKTIAPVRGFIFAEGGELLAGSLPEYDVYLDFKSTTKPDAQNKVNIPLDTVLAYFGPNGEGSKALANAYSINPEKNTKSAAQRGEEVLKAYNQRKGHYLILRALPYMDYQRLRKQPYFNKIRYRNGLQREERAHRYRPYGDRRMAAASIGTVYTKNGKDSTQLAGHGQRGIEKGYDKELAGIPGKGIEQKVRKRMTNITLQPAVNGSNVHLTLNVEMQEILDYELAKRIVELNAAEGWAAFLEVKTGKIKAISNMKRIGDRCVEDYNHLFEDLVDPGSTFKTVSYMILLENGKITPDTLIDTGNYDNNYPVPWDYHGQKIRDDHAIGKQTADECIVQSSNIGVAKMTVGAYEHDKQAYLDAIDKIGFLDDHALTDSDRAIIKRDGYVTCEALRREFPGIRSARHRQLTSRSWSKVSLGQVSYGYETQIPGIFMLQFYNAIANNGKLVRPYLVDYVEKDGQVTYRQEPTVINPKICSEKTLMAVRHALEGVVEHGTAAGRPKGHPKGFLEGVKTSKVKIAGKTGTAQRFNQATKSFSGAGHNVSFVGYFPADEPEYCGIVVINSYGSGISRAGGGFMAGPVFKHFAEQVYARNCVRKLKELPADTLHPATPRIKKGPIAETQTVLDKLGIKADSTGFKSVEFSEAMAGKVPNVTGMGASDALLMLESAGFRQVSIHGFGKVVSQQPAAGTNATASQSITLQLK